MSDQQLRAFQRWYNPIPQEIGLPHSPRIKHKKKQVRMKVKMKKAACLNKHTWVACMSLVPYPCIITFILTTNQ